VGVLFWHASEVDRLAFEGLVRGLRIARVASDIDEFHARFDPSVATTEAGLRLEQSRAEQAARSRLRSWRQTRSIDLLVAMGTQAALIAADEYRDVPIVFTAVTNPAASGVTPKTKFGPTGRNLAGNSNWIGIDRVLDTFRRTVPGLARLGVVASPRNAVSQTEIEEARRYVEREKVPVTLDVRDAASPEQLSEAVASLAPDIDALWIPIDDLCYRNVPRIQRALGERDVPLLSSSRQAVRNGAVVGLTCDYELLGMSAAEIVRKILVDGRDPGTIPIGRLKTFELLVNLEAAGLRLPPEIVASADRLLPEADR
jgi:putative ABC transport system substrate-binding protein